MLVACRLAGLSALGAHYGASNEAQCRARLRDALVTPAGNPRRFPSAFRTGFGSTLIKWAAFCCGETDDNIVRLRRGAAGE